MRVTSAGSKNGGVMSDPVMMPEPADKLTQSLFDGGVRAKSGHRGELFDVGVGSAHVAGRPAKGRQNIWELTLHAAYWKYTVWLRLTGQKRGSFPLKGSDFFPSPAKPTDAEWRDAIAVLDSVHRQLRDAIAALPPSD